jgi:hypothetical protein
MKFFPDSIQKLRDVQAPKLLWKIIYFIGAALTVLIIAISYLESFYCIRKISIPLIGKYLYYFLLNPQSTQCIFLIIAVLSGIFFKSIRVIASSMLASFVIFPFFFLWSFLFWNSKTYNPEWDLRTIMKTSLRIPGQTKPGLFSIMEGFQEDNWLDLEPISQEEWDNVICKDVNIKDKDYPEGKKSFKESPHGKCIRPVLIPKYLYPKHAIPYLSTGDILNSSCIDITFNEYIFKYPKIFNNILKIAEKPCYYLRDNKVPGYSSMYCNRLKSNWWESEKTCIVINIVDSKGFHRSQIRVIRKDNVHLSKNNKIKSNY